MRFYVGITDDDWFTYLSGSGAADEVNFWQPSGGRQFRVLQPGEPFLFKLHSPKNYIVGGGFFSHFTILPVSFAWSAFTAKNGAQTEKEMRQGLRATGEFRQVRLKTMRLAASFFNLPSFFLKMSGFLLRIGPRTLFKGKLRHNGRERAIHWQQVEDRLKFYKGADAPPAEVTQVGPRFGTPQLMLPRLGQGSFRVLVTDAYKRRCAFTDSPVLHVLEAAHIKPYSDGGPHAVNNGILLRQDVHTLFDRGYITSRPNIASR